MKINDSDIQEFITIYQEEFGEELSFAEASEIAFRLFSLYTLLTGVLPGEKNINISLSKG